jgi:hypothetical protein
VVNWELVGSAPAARGAVLWLEVAAPGEAPASEEEARCGMVVKAPSDWRSSGAEARAAASRGRHDEEKMDFSLLGPRWRGIRQP